MRDATDTAPAGVVGAASDTETISGLSRRNTAAEARAGTLDEGHMTPLKTAQAIAAKSVTLGTAVAASGTAILFTGIPAGVKHIVISFSGLSTNGTDSYVVQIGDSGGIEATGYLGASGLMQDAATSVVANFTVGLGIISASNANAHHGTVTLTLIDPATNLWVMALIDAFSSGAVAGSGASTKALTGELTQLKITTTGGTNTFDAGTINIAYS